jgi:signal transduction histidine kinase
MASRPPPQGPQLTARLPSHSSAVMLARAAIDGFELSPDVRDDARLIVSELVSNAVRHGQGDITLLLSRTDDGALSGTVLDDGEGFRPRAGRPTGMDHGGWGLPIVDSLSEKWGIDNGAGRVWFQMAA